MNVLDSRFNDLRDLLRSDIKRVEQLLTVRIQSLERRITDASRDNEDLERLIQSIRARRRQRDAAAIEADITAMLEDNRAALDRWQRKSQPETPEPRTETATLAAEMAREIMNDPNFKAEMIALVRQALRDTSTSTEGQ